jgi:hypothetical protein
LIRDNWGKRRLGGATVDRDTSESATAKRYTGSKNDANYGDFLKDAKAEALIVNIPRVHLLVCFTRAREAPSSGASRPTRRCADATDPIEPALRLLADVDAPKFFFAEFFFAIAVGGQRWSSSGQRRW